MHMQNFKGAASHHEGFGIKVKETVPPIYFSRMPEATVPMQWCLFWLLYNEK